MIPRRSLLALPSIAAAGSPGRVRSGWPALLELSGTPGAAVARIERGRLAWAEYLGVRRAGEARAISERTMFQTASLTKPLAAYAALRMKDEGRLDLDRPLNDYLAFSSRERPMRVTARHALSHSTGFPNWRFKEGEELDCSFEPGSKFGYSGEGFYLLQSVMEKIEGAPFAEIMSSRALNPLGMADSTLTAVPPLAQAAAGHSRRGEPRPPFKPTGDLPVNRIPNAAATLSATLPDYVRFLIRAFDRSDWFVSTTKINTALSWGLGWGLEDHQGGQWCWHWGDNPGFKNIVLCQPAKRSGLLVFTNGDNGRALYERIARDVLGDGHAAFLWI